MTEPAARPANWRIISAGILDFFLAFAGGGYIVARLTGNTHQYGFKLEGWPAIAAFAVIVAYFIIGNRFFRGTLFKHVFGIASPRV